MKYNYFPLWLEIRNLLEEVADSTEQSNKEMCAMFVKATSQNTLRFFLSHLCILCQRAPWLVASENPGLCCYRIIHYYVELSVHEAAEGSEIYSSR